MLHDEAREIDDMVERLETEEVQRQLLKGFQQDFATTISVSWKRSRYLSPRQIEVLKDILQRYDPQSKRSSFQSRRYEGFDPKRHK